MNKIIENSLFKTKIVKTRDYIKIEQYDKITDLKRKVILSNKEIRELDNMINDRK